MVGFILYYSPCFREIKHAIYNLKKDLTKTFVLIYFLMEMLIKYGHVTYIRIYVLIQLYCVVLLHNSSETFNKPIKTLNISEAYLMFIKATN